MVKSQDSLFHDWLLFIKFYPDQDIQITSHRILRMYRKGDRFQPLQEEILDFLFEKSKDNFNLTLTLSILSFREVGNLEEFKKFVESLDSFFEKRNSIGQASYVEISKHFLVNLGNILEMGMNTELSNGNRLDCLEFLGFLVQDFPKKLKIEL